MQLRFIYDVGYDNQKLPLTCKTTFSCWKKIANLTFVNYLVRQTRPKYRVLYAKMGTGLKKYTTAGDVLLYVNCMMDDIIPDVSAKVRKPEKNFQI